jgi:chloride channel protein, CIC family
MTGDYALTLPVMLAVAIATATSRALSYGTIYTTKLLRRGYDVDRAAPWRAFADMTAADAMRPFPTPLTVTAARDGDGSHTPGADAGAAAPRTPLPGTITYHSNPQAVYASESLTQTLRQLAAYGRDGLPVLASQGGQAAGWITNDSVLHAIARQIGTAPPQAGAPPAQAADTGPVSQPPTPLPGYQVLEITIDPGSPGAGKAIGTLTWPPGHLPVSVLHGSTLHEPHPDLVLAPGDRISLLTSTQSANGTDRAGPDSHTPS